LDIHGTIGETLLLLLLGTDLLGKKDFDCPSFFAGSIVPHFDIFLGEAQYIITCQQAISLKPSSLLGTLISKKVCKKFARYMNKLLNVAYPMFFYFWPVKYDNTLVETTPFEPGWDALLHRLPSRFRPAATKGCTLLHRLGYGPVQKGAAPGLPSAPGSTPFCTGL
jgi:hypothetical protein